MSAWLTPLPEGGSGADSFSVSPVIPALLVRVAPRAQAITPARSRLLCVSRSISPCTSCTGSGLAPHSSRLGPAFSQTVRP